MKPIKILFILFLLLTALISDETNATFQSNQYNIRGFLYYKKGDYDKAIKFYNMALNVKFTLVKEDTSEIAIIYDSIGSSWDKKGEYDKAIKFYEKALKIQLDTLGKNHFDIVADSYEKIALILFVHKNEDEKALKYYAKALDIKLLILDKNHISIANLYKQIAWIWQSRKDYDKAIEFYHKALRIVEKNNYADNIKANIFNQLAGIYNEQKAYKIAIDYYNKSLILYKKILVIDLYKNYWILDNISNIYDIYIKNNQPQKAKKIVVENLKFYKKLFQKDREKYGKKYIGFIIDSIKKYHIDSKQLAEAKEILATLPKNSETEGLLLQIEEIEGSYSIYILLLFIIFLGVTIFYIKRYRHPIVQKLSKTPKALLLLPLEQLQEAQKRLSTIDRFKNILSENNITQERYTQATTFTTMTPNQKAKYLSQRIFAQSTSLGTDSYMMTLKDDFPLNVKNFILFFSNKESLDDMMSDIKEIPQYRSHILFVLSDSSEKQLRLYEQGAKHEKIVLPHPKEMTRLLLESDGSKVLADIFALQLALTQISPYQLGGGVKSSMFFGRAEIVSHILGRDNSNYIVIGSRQIGKSSLLKAIEREYKKSHEEVYYISLNAGNLVKGMAKALRLRAKTLDEVVSYLLQEPKPYLFLIDEADKFVQYEKAQGYETLNALRKLSEEGRANFIVAGFWELYQHAVLDYQSPLKNFGETIELGALEQEACEEMMREPMKQLGLTIEREAIESVIDQVGQRANLIAIVCHNIIKNLGKTKKEITLQDAQEAMKEKNVFELFESWRELNDDERANRLDRIIVYATVKEGKFTLKSLLDSLKERGLRVDIAEIEKSLDRLNVSYTIERNSKGEYVYRVALFREYILRGEYEVKLSGEIEAYG